jgi:DNA repair protein RadA/Sms
MKRAKTVSQFVCQSCGSSSPRWLGKCPECGSWNTYVEEKMEKAGKAARKADSLEPVAITRIKSDREERIPTGNKELDRVLGGGFVPGSVILVGGDPGIGKSTLALQMLNNIGAGKQKNKEEKYGPPGQGSLRITYSYSRRHPSKPYSTKSRICPRK